MRKLSVGITETLTGNPCIREIDKAIKHFSKDPTVVIEIVPTDITELEEVKEYFLNMVDLVDVLVICIAEVNIPTMSAVSWMMGYSWSQGVPIALVSLAETLEAATLGLFSTTPIAYVNTQQELSELDFSVISYL